MSRRRYAPDATTGSRVPDRRTSFPATRGTWISERLHEGADGLADVQRHVMEVYSEPLQAYFRRSRYRGCGDATDFVHGFFVSRLTRPDYLLRWQQHGGLLRAWLANGLFFHVRETRATRWELRVQDEPPELASLEPEPWAALCAAFLTSIVRRAMKIAAAECQQAGLSLHWEVFVRRRYRECSYREIADQLAIPVECAPDLARVAGRRFRKALRDVLLSDGVAPDRISSALTDLLETTRTQ